MKEPSKEPVLRTKSLLEAGFLSAKLPNGMSRAMERQAEQLLAAHDKRDAAGLARSTASLACACVPGWRAYWRSLAEK